jgi:hypothetical protein
LHPLFTPQLWSQQGEPYFSLNVALTPAQSTQAAQDAVATLLFSLGLSAHGIALIKGPLLDALLAAKTLQSSSSMIREDGIFDSVLSEKLLPYLKSLIAGRKIVLSVDCKDQDMARGRAIVHITFSCIHIQADILAEGLCFSLMLPQMLRHMPRKLNT